MAPVICPGPPPAEAWPTPGLHLMGVVGGEGVELGMWRETEGGVDSGLCPPPEMVGLRAVN